MMHDIAWLFICDGSNEGDDERVLHQKIKMRKIDKERDASMGSRSGCGQRKFRDGWGIHRDDS